MEARRHALPQEDTLEAHHAVPAQGLHALGW